MECSQYVMRVLCPFWNCDSSLHNLAGFINCKFRALNIVGKIAFKESDPITVSYKFFKIKAAKLQIFQNKIQLLQIFQNSFRLPHHRYVCVQQLALLAAGGAAERYSTVIMPFSVNFFPNGFEY